MPDGLNKVMLIGNLDSEPETKFAANGSANTSFRLAVSRSYLVDDERRVETSRFNVIAWARLAETLAQVLTRGTRVLVEGRVSTRTWDGPDGQRQYRTEIVASNVMVLQLNNRDDLPSEAISEDDDGSLGEQGWPEGLNRVMVIGNLGAEPEMRYTATGSAVTNIRVAASRNVPSPEGRRDETEWFGVVSWGKLAEFLGSYIRKGRKVYVEGRLTNRSWVGQDGQRRYRTEVNADQVIPLDRAPGGAQYSEGGMGMGMPSGGDLDPDDLPFE